MSRRWSCTRNCWRSGTRSFRTICRPARATPSRCRGCRKPFPARRCPRLRPRNRPRSRRRWRGWVRRAANGLRRPNRPQSRFFRVANIALLVTPLRHKLYRRSVDATLRQARAFLVKAKKNSRKNSKGRGCMKDFAGKIAVITGGGTGMGRELARRLVAEGCNVAMCDVSAAAMAETKRLCEVEKLPQGLRITTHIADVSNEDDVKRFRDELAEQQATDKIHLLFNNAGIGGGGSLFTNTREQWEKTFNICWGGVYLGVRTFLPLLLKADEGHIVNTSSVNGFWASVGMLRSHTAYSAAKFAVKGFTEALINDLRLNAPHIKCSVVMPGHIGTSIMSNSRKIQSGTDSERLTDNEVALARVRLAAT